MGKRKHRDPAERAARARRREARSERSIRRTVNAIAAREYEARLRHELELTPPEQGGFIHALACRECEWTGPAFERVPTDKGGEYRCPDCGHVYGGWLNKGTLDLELAEPCATCEGDGGVDEPDGYSFVRCQCADCGGTGVARQTSNSVTPLNENEKHDSTATTG